MYSAEFFFFFFFLRFADLKPENIFAILKFKDASVFLPTY
jgi:hypothetical protein